MEAPSTPSRLVSDEVAGEILALAYDLDWDVDDCGHDSKSRLTLTIHGELRCGDLVAMADKLTLLKQKLLIAESFKS